MASRYGSWGWVGLVLLVSCSLAATVKAHPTADEPEPGAQPSPHPDRIMVTWTADPATSFTVTWRTDAGTDTGRGQIALAEASPDFDDAKRSRRASQQALATGEHAQQNVPANYHSVTFNDLEPNTLYAYRVGHEDHWSEWLHIRTAASEPEPFSFIYIGDAQNEIHSHWSRAIRAAYAHGSPEADFALHAGDLVNKGHRNVEWARWHRAGGWIQRTLPSIAVPGNHEYIDGLSIHWRPQFAFPKNGPDGLQDTAYYVDYQGVRFIALNSNEQVEKQARWLENVLEDNPHPWTIVTHHHPIYASAEGRDNEQLRKHWQPLYQKHGVDLVLQGHDHTYARGQTQNLTGGVNVRERDTGTVYVNSVSGAKMYSIRDDKWSAYDDVSMQRSAENTQLFQLIDVSQQRIEYRAYTVTGELYDAFKLKRSEDGETTRFVEQMPDTPDRTHENTEP